MSIAIEGIKNAQMTYQGSVSQGQGKAAGQPKEEAAALDVKTAEKTGTGEDFTVREKIHGENQTEAKAEYGQQGEQTKTNTGFEAMKKAVNEINKHNENSIVQFGIHEATNHMTVKILDKETKKVIKEFPAEKTLDLIAKVWELAGIMIDERG